VRSACAADPGGAFIGSTSIRFLLARIRVPASSRKLDLLTSAAKPFRADSHRESGGVEPIENKEKFVVDGVNPPQNRIPRHVGTVNPTRKTNCASISTVDPSRTTI
jgi:hypothetical protein